MHTTVVKQKTNLAAGSACFNFSEASTIPARKGMSLVITAADGPFARIEATLFDINDLARDATGDTEGKDPRSTAPTGKVEWPFPAEECPGGYLKWRIWPEAVVGGPRDFRITEEIRENGVTIQSTVVSGTIAADTLVDTPFLDGVQIAGSGN